MQVYIETTGGSRMEGFTRYVKASIRSVHPDIPLQLSSHFVTDILVLSFTQENAVVLYSVGRVRQHSATKVGGKLIGPVKNIGLCHLITFFPLVAIC
jgi:hypothetical protein